MGKSIPLLFCVLAMMMASGGAIFLPFRWDVRQEVDSNGKLVITINGETPCPTIRAQQGDTIFLEVTNSLPEENLAVRWDGIRQIGTPSCDGTNGPILPGETCTYRFAADQAGEYSYQSEYEMQMLAGLQGTIVVLPQGLEDP